MDRLARKAAAAKAEGLSYGQWVAKHPEGLPEEPEKEEKPEAEKLPRTRTKTCIWCGQKFTVTNSFHRKYCGPECSDAAAKHRALGYGAKHRAKKRQEAKND